MFFFVVVFLRATDWLVCPRARRLHQHLLLGVTSPDSLHMWLACGRRLFENIASVRGGGGVR